MRWNKTLIALALATPMAAAYKTLCTVVAANDDDRTHHCLDTKRSSEECAALAHSFSDNGYKENACTYVALVGDATYEELEEICTAEGAEMLSFEKPPSDGSCIVPDL